MRGFWRSAARRRLGTAILCGVTGLSWGAAVWAQPGPEQPAPNQALPPGHPPVQAPPGLRPTPQQFPARPVPRPGPPALPVAPAPVEKSKDAPHGGGRACPGHGPNDVPHHINLWQGIIAVNNEKASQGGFLNRLLWRYYNKADPCDEKNTPPPLLASILNFGVLAFILYRFGRKPLSDALVKRKQSIMSEIDTATRLKQESLERLQEYEERFERIEETLSTLMAEYAAQSEREKRHVLVEAEERRARMKRDAQFRIEQELKAARIELLHEAVEGAIAAAQELIQKRVSEADVQRMADDYLGSVSMALGASGREALGAVAAPGGRS